MAEFSFQLVIPKPAQDQPFDFFPGGQHAAEWHRPAGGSECPLVLDSASSEYFLVLTARLPSQLSRPPKFRPLQKIRIAV